MIAAALKDKLRARGPLLTAYDAAENILALGLIGGWAFTLTAAAIAGAIAAVPFVAWEVIKEARMGARPHRCDADCAAGRTECEPSQGYFRTEAICGHSVTASTSVGLNTAILRHETLCSDATEKRRRRS
jgi:hypothetical protein